MFGAILSHLGAIKIRNPGIEKLVRAFKNLLKHKTPFEGLMASVRVDKDFAPPSIYMPERQNYCPEPRNYTHVQKILCPSKGKLIPRLKKYCLKYFSRVLLLIWKYERIAIASIGVFFHQKNPAGLLF